MEHLLVQLHNELNKSSIDWTKVKDVLKAIAETIASIAIALPSGALKNILLGVAAAINLAIGMLPFSMLKLS